jgi:hypothetical protein
MARVEKSNVSTAVIVQNVGGDLRLKGRPGGWLVVDGEGAFAEQIGQGQPYVVRCTGDARITVPDDVTVSVQSVGGDAKLTDLGGAADVQSVGGDLTLRDVQEINITSVGGDLRIKRADGNVNVESVGSDATIREVEGSVHVRSIGSDLYVRNVTENCLVENVGSDLLVNIDFVAGREYRFSAHSDILCRVQPETQATIILPLETEVRIDVEAEVKQVEDGDQQVLTLGEGGAAVYIDKADTLRLVGDGEDYMANFGVQIEEEVEARLSTLEEKLNQQLEGLDERILAQTARLTSQAERIAERAQRQAERATERFRRNMDRQVKRKRDPGARRATFSAEMAGTSRRSREPVTEQERLLILQMVQEKKISIEEAERLLSALDT